MTLSIFLLILPIIILPVLLLPHNKKFILNYSLLFGIATSAFIFILSRIITGFDYTIGKTFYPIFSWFVDAHIELNFTERYHISFMLVLFIIIIITFLISFILSSIFYMGKNPSVSKNSNKMYLALENIFTIVLLYMTISYFLITIRLIILLPDGFFSPIFNLIYKIEA